MTLWKAQVFKINPDKLFPSKFFDFYLSPIILKIKSIKNDLNNMLVTTSH